MNPTQKPDNSSSESRPFGENFLGDLFTDTDRFRAWIASATGTTAPPLNTPKTVCSCGDNDCSDTFGRATAGQDRSGCCQYCGYYDCDVCGWSNPARSVPETTGYDLTDAGRAALAMTPSTCPVDLVTETDDETTTRVLRDAATYLERHGWIQGAYYDATSGSFTPPACLVGAVGMVCYGGPVDAPAQHFDNPGFLDFEAAVLHLDRYLLAENGSESYDFNDAKGRQADDVTHVLRDAAVRPAHELIDALRAIDQHNADTAALVETLVPCGVARCPYCASTRRAVRAVIDEGDGPAFCDHDWHDGDELDGGDAR